MASRKKPAPKKATKATKKTSRASSDFISGGYKFAATQEGSDPLQDISVIISLSMVQVSLSKQMRIQELGFLGVSSESKDLSGPRDNVV